MNTPKKAKYQIMPALTPDAHAELKASIAERGRVEKRPIVDENGEMLDGFAREGICKELGIPCNEKEVRRFGSEAEKLAFVVTVNVKRRQMDRLQREALIRAYLLKDPAIADNTLAKLIGGIGKNKVADVRAEMEAACLLDKVEKRRGADGKMYPAQYPRIVVNSDTEMKAALKAIKDLPLNGKTMDATTAARRARRTAAKKARQAELIVPLPEDAIKLYHCPFQQLEQIAGIAPASVNLVCTDIPYGKEFLSQIGKLAAMAARVLVDGGLFVTHSGHYYLDQVVRLLGEHLTYRWTMASIWNGDANMVHPLDLSSQWKPILVYSHGPWRKRGRWHDVSRVDSKEKDCHEWQQPIEEVETLVRYFSRPGDLVIDPCGGGFTTAVACKNLGRRCISSDVDFQAVLAGQARLDNNLTQTADFKEFLAEQEQLPPPMEIQRSWCMPSHETFKIKPIRELLRKYNVGTGWIDPFAGDNSPAEYTNDHDPSKATMFHLDALEFVRSMQGTYVGAVFDPPFPPAKYRNTIAQWARRLAVKDA